MVMLLSEKLFDEVCVADGGKVWKNEKEKYVWESGGGLMLARLCPRIIYNSAMTMQVVDI